MNTDELLEAKAALREFAEQAELGWVLAELDEAVALGVIEVKALRPAKRGEGQFYEEVPAAGASTRGRKRAEEFLTRRPMTDQEQVETFLAALRRVLVDADAVAQAAIRQLAELGQRPLLEASSPELAKPLERQGPAVVEEIDFLPDEGSTAPAVTTEAIRHDVDRGAVIAQILDQLLIAVRQ